MKKILAYLATKPKLFFVDLGFIVLMLLALMLTIALDGGQMKITDNSKTLIYIFATLGIIIDVFGLILDNKYTDYLLPIIGATMYAAALGRALNLVAYPIADLVTGVNWFGGSLGVYLTLFILYLIGTIYGVAKAFIKPLKN